MRTVSISFVFFMILLLGSLSAQAPRTERYLNASHFVGDEVDDPLLPINQDLLQSQELISLQSPSIPRVGYWQSHDFFEIPNDPSASLTEGPRINHVSDNPYNPSSSGTALTPETHATLGDIDGDGFAEPIRVYQDNACELIIRWHEDRIDMTLQDTIIQSHQSNFLNFYKISPDSNSCNYFPEGHQLVQLEAISIPGYDRQFLVVGHLAGDSTDQYQLHLKLLDLQQVWWKSRLIDSLILPISMANNQTGISAPYFDLVAADMDLNGEQELWVAANGGTQTMIWGIGIDEQAFDVETLTYVDEVPFLGNVSLTTGDFDGDIAPELVLGLPERIPAQVDIHLLLFQAMDDSAISGINPLDTLLLVASGTQFNPLIILSNDPTYRSNLKLASGNLAGGREDELVLAMYDWYVHPSNGEYLTRQRFNHLALYGVGESFRLDSTIAAVGYNDWTSGPMPGEFLSVADLDRDGIDEINLLQMRTNTQSNWLSEYSYQINSFQYLPSGSNLSDRLESVGEFDPTPNGAFFSPFDYRQIHLLAGDVDGDNIRLGTPKFYRETNLQQPLAVLNAPPVHFDQFNGQTFDINECYGGQNCGFFAEYSEQTTINFAAKTEVHSDWAVSGTLSGSGGGTGASVSAALTTTYGESFGSYKGMGSTMSISSNIRATVEDLIYATIANYGVFEYPIYKGDSLVGHIMTVTPEVTQNSWFSSNSWIAYDYFPRHEIGNILSYQNYASTLDDPTLSNLIEQAQGGDGYQINSFSDYTFGVASSTFQSAGSTHGVNFGVGASTTVTAGKKLFGVGAEISATVEGEYNREEVSTYETTTTDEISLSVGLGSTSNSLNLESNYVVTPYIYWAKNGALIVDYSVDPEVSVQGGTNTWWSSNYSQAADPSLILPFRYSPEKGFVLEEEIKRLQAKSITYEPANPEPGDTITLYAAVHNYSLIPTTGAVEAAFYLGNPNCPGSVQLTSIDGQQTAFTRGNHIAPQSRELLIFRWAIPNNITTTPRIYLQLDPNNSMTEIHENNNLGWTILEVLGTGPTEYCNTLTTSLTDEIQLITDVHVSPNPFVDQTKLRFDLPSAADVRLDIFDMTGRNIRSLVDEALFAGEHQYSFVADDLPAGVYVYRLQVDGQQKSGRIVLKK